MKNDKNEYKNKNMKEKNKYLIRSKLKSMNNYKNALFLQKFTVKVLKPRTLRKIIINKINNGNI
jgi:hypothetical protein